MKTFRAFIFSILLIFLSGVEIIHAQWTTYLTNDPDVDHINYIVTEGNNVWCATNGGINRWNRLDGSHELWSYFATKISVFNCGAVDWNGVKWFGASNYILTINDSTWVKYPVDGDVGSIAVDSKNKRIIFQLAKYAILQHGQYGEKTVTFLSYDSEKWGEKWLAGSGNSMYPVFTLLISDKVSPGNLWSNGNNGGIIYYILTDQGYTLSRPVTGGTSWIAMDNDGNIWMNSYDTDNTIRMYNRYNNTVTTYDSSYFDGIGRRAQKICIDRNNVKYIAYDSTLVRYDNTTWSSYPFPKSGSPSSMTTDESGGVWIGRADGLFRFHPPVTGVNENNSLPQSLKIIGNYPNPFNPTTTISYILDAFGNANLSVYSLTGQRIRTLVTCPQSAGFHSVIWDGRDDEGKPVSSGVYISRLHMGDKVAVNRMLLLK